MKKAVVIGGGIAGIASALRLKAKGYDVTIIEQSEKLGGKIGELSKAGYRFDTGPSLFTLPHLVDELFALFNKNARDNFNYKKLDVVCKYFFSDGTTFSAYSEAGRLTAEIEEVFKIHPNVIQKYLSKYKELYNITAPLFIFSSIHRLKVLFSQNFFRGIFNFYKIGMFRTMNRVNKKLLKHPYLVQVFNRFATYNGSNPYVAPSTLNVIAHLEFSLGAFFPEAGMRGIVNALEKLMLDTGIDIRLNEKVESINIVKGKVTGVKTEHGFFEADICISDIDVYQAYKLLPNKKLANRYSKQERSTSALIFYWSVSKAFENLDLHNILFADNYKEEFRYLFKTKELYHDPTVYIFISKKQVANDAPTGCENWFVMINVPENIGQDWDTIIDKARIQIQAKIKSILGVEINKHIENEFVQDPRMIEKHTSSFHGSLYGTSSNNRMAAFNRHPNFSRKYKGLYFVGGSVHPGGGIPLCLSSAKIVDELIS